MINTSVLLSFDIRMNGLNWWRLSLQSGLVSHISSSRRIFFVSRIANPAAQRNHNRLHVMPDRFLRSASLAFFRLRNGLPLHSTKESRTLDHFVSGLFRILWSLHVYMLLIDKATRVECCLAFDSLDGMQACYTCLTRIFVNHYFRRVVWSEFVC